MSESCERWGKYCVEFRCMIHNFVELLLDSGDDVWCIGRKIQFPWIYRK